MVPVNAPGRIVAIAISFITICSFFSCKKTDTVNTVTEQPAGFNKKVIASVNGFVTNEYNSPVAGANVQYGESFSTTDQYGCFEIKNATVTENAGVVTIKMDGYFKGVKTFIAAVGKKNFCRIKLIPKTNSGTVDAASGGDVTLPNGLKISLPPAGMVDAATKTAYSGIVNVYSSWINPIADDIDEIMPGDLRGINTNGSLRSLTSFGMAAVELTGNAGQLLQIAEGKNATLTFPLPNIVAADAPPVIPLWYFDETKGLWIEEGTATKTGNTYAGDVKHFTFWNCDLPNATIPLSFVVVDSLQRPLSNVNVEITPTTSNSWSHVGGFTDETGYVNVPVTANTQYKLQFLNTCSDFFPYIKNFSVESKAVDLGNVVIRNGSIAIITGTAKNCNNAPLGYGRIMLRNEDYLRIINTDNEGVFSYSTFMCDNTNEWDFIAEDQSSSQQGHPLKFTINPGINNIGNLQACGISTNEYSNLTIDGQNYILGPFLNGVINSAASSVPVESVYGIGLNISLSTQVNGTYLNYGDQVNWMFTHSQTTGVPGNQNYIYDIQYFPGSGNPNSSPLILLPKTKHISVIPGSAPLTITEFGGIGEYISGYINDTLYSIFPNYMIDTSSRHHVIYNFRVKKYY